MKIVAAFLALTLLALRADGLCTKGAFDCLGEAATLTAAAVTKDGICTKYTDLYYCYLTSGCESADAIESCDVACGGQCDDCTAGANAVKMSILTTSVAVLIAYLHA